MGSKDARAPRLIRRYGNRKLYDPEAAGYVTLEDLARMVAEGQEVEIVDQKSGEDLTNATLAQVLLDGIRQGASRIPRHVLVRLIRLAAGPAQAWGEWPEPRDAAGRARREAEQIVSRLLGQGRLSLDQAVALRRDLGQLVHERVREAQTAVEARLRSLLDQGGDVAGRSLQALQGRLRAFESYLAPPPPPRRVGPGRSTRKASGRKRRAPARARAGRPTRSRDS